MSNEPGTNSSGRQRRMYDQFAEPAYGTPRQNSQPARSSPQGQSGGRPARAAQPAHGSQSDARRQRPPRPQQPDDRASAPTRQRAAASRGAQPRRRKKKRGHGVLIALLVVAMLGTGVYALYSTYMGRIEGDDVLPQEVKTPTWQGSDVVSGLVCGIDYDNETADGYASSEKVGRTDMILYLRYDTKNNKATAMQIPRDTYVGEANQLKDSGGNALVTKNFTGKINSVYYNAADKQNRMAALAYVINQQFKLPVDFYVTIDMEALKEIVDIKGWIEIYVPVDISDPDHPSSVIPQGWQNLTSGQVEFLLRNRYSPTYKEQGDVARLQTQQSFYSALYREFKTLQPKDLVMWMNVLTYRCKTDMDIMQLGGLAQKALGLQGADITFIRPPCGVANTAAGQSVVSLVKEETSGLLNQYLRAEGQEVPSSQLGLIELPMNVGTFPADVKTMADVQSVEAPQ